MAKKGLRGGASYKAQYQGYKIEGRWKKNKIRKLEKRILANENDTGAVDALEKLNKSGKQYGRQKPKGKGWFHPQEIKLLKEAKSEKEVDRFMAMEKLRKLYSDRDRFYYKPSAINNPEVLEPNKSVADQLFNIGMINEKRRGVVNARMGSLRKRRAVSNRR